MLIGCRGTTWAVPSTKVCAAAYVPRCSSSPMPNSSSAGFGVDLGGVVAHGRDADRFQGRDEVGVLLPGRLVRVLGGRRGARGRGRAHAVAGVALALGGGAARVSEGELALAAVGDVGGRRRVPRGCDRDRRHDAWRRYGSLGSHSLWRHRSFPTSSLLPRAVVVRLPAGAQRLDYGGLAG